MAVAPGVYVTSRAQAPPRSAPTDTGMTFMLGKTEKGPLTPTEVSSFADYEAQFGKRAGFIDLYDAVEAYYQEGGAKLTIQRYGPGITVEVKGAKSASSEPAVEGVLAEPRAAPSDLPGALALLTKDLGPGQIVVPGADGQATSGQNAMLSTAATTNRIALLDPPAASLSASALTTLAGTLSAAAEARYGALFAPTALVAPYAVGSGLRVVPFSAIAAGLIARNDASGSPNRPAAGDNGQSRWAVDLGYVYTEAERGSLNDAGVDLARLIYGGVELYGYRTLAPASSGWLALNNARLNMAIVAEAEAIGERYVFRQIDGRRVTISQFAADLTSMLVAYYEQGSLFGTTADDAFYVDVGPQVNTLATIAAGELHAVIACRMSPFAERVYIEIVKTATEIPLAVAA